MNKRRAESFIKSVSQDIKSIKITETEDKLEMRIGNFFITRKLSEDIEHDYKKLFEDFMTHISTYYTRCFWEL